MVEKCQHVNITRPKEIGPLRKLISKHWMNSAKLFSMVSPIWLCCEIMSKLGLISLKMGGIGFFLGFASWIAWVVLVVLSFASTPRLEDLPNLLMGGVYFTSATSRLIFYGLLTLSSIFNAVGCFALFKEQASKLVLLSGILFAATFVVLAMQIFSTLFTSVFFRMVSHYLFSSVFFVALILWGATLWKNAVKTSVSGLSHATGMAFVASGALGLLLWHVILYWGFELWLLICGWLYAAGALATALIFFRLSKTPQKLSALGQKN